MMMHAINAPTTSSFALRDASPLARAAMTMGTVGICLIAVLRTMVVFSTRVYFDIDPAMTAERFAGMGMPGSLLLDVLLLLSSGLLLVGLLLAGVHVRMWVLLLTFAGGLVVYGHGFSGIGDAEHLWRGSTWFAALLAAVALAHLPRRSHLRMMAIIVLLSVLAPLLVRGGLQITMEHQDTVRQFEQQREQFFESRGWQLDSPQARIYERRLRQAQPRGWFETTNIFASCMIAFLVIFSGMTIVAVRRKLPSGFAGITGLSAALAGYGIWLSGSRGAILTALAVCALLLLPLVLMRTSYKAAALWIMRHVGMIAVLAMIVAIVGIVVRGVILPEEFLGEKSLLFRWHYLVGATRTLLDHFLFGVGPGGVQDAYMFYRPQRSPEEVASTHNVFADWLVMLGVVGGLAWCAVLAVCAWRFIPLRIDDGEDDHEPDANEQRGDARPMIVCIAMIITLLAAAVSLTLEFAAIDPVLVMFRLLGFVAMFMLAVFLAYLLHMLMSSVRGDMWLVHWSVAVAAIGLLVHGQIEMTFFQPGSVVWVLCMIALASHLGSAASAPMRRWQSIQLLCISAIILTCCGWLLFSAIRPAWQQQQMITRAAASLVVPDDRATLVAAKRRAADMLRSSHAQWPANSLPLLDAVEQLRHAAALTDRAQRLELLEEALQDAQRAARLYPSQSGPLSMVAIIAWQRAAADGTDANWQEAIDAAARMTERDPHAVASWERLGDVLWSADRIDEARVAYQRALQNNANFVLDEMKQLSEARLQLLQRRIDS